MLRLVMSLVRSRKGDNTYLYLKCGRDTRYYIGPETVSEGFKPRLESLRPARDYVVSRIEHYLHVLSVLNNYLPKGERVRLQEIWSPKKKRTLTIPEILYLLRSMGLIEQDNITKKWKLRTAVEDMMLPVTPDKKE